MKKIIFLLALLPLVFSCSSDDDKDEFVVNKNFPVLPVKFQLNTAKTGEDAILREKGNYKFFQTIRVSDEKLGLSGLLVYRAQKELKAYDMACPVESRIHPLYLLREVNGNKVKCAYGCESEFNLDNGEPLSGKALENKYRLIQYKAEDKGYEITYWISNPKYKE